MSKENNKEKVICVKHGNNPIDISNFYKASDQSVYSGVGLIPVCKTCIIKQFKIYIDKYNDSKEATFYLCRWLDIAFISTIYESILTNPRWNGETDKMFGLYITMYNSLGSTNGTDLNFDGGEQSFNEYDKDEDSVEPNAKYLEMSKKEMTKLEEKWGVGYSQEELYLFEKKYSMLRNNYSEKTAMHTEALYNYIRYRVKEELATAGSNVKEAKEWGALAAAAAKDAKITPSQLSKADLSDGLSTFSELSEAVEKEVDIIPILPKFKYRPNDALDFNIWCYVNYIRDLNGLPPCDYEDVYAFYDRRKEDYIEQYGDPYGILEGDPSIKNRENIKKFINEDTE